MVDIIDLTSDPPAPIEISSGDDSPLPSVQQGVPKEKRRRERKKRSRGPIADGAGSSTQNSRAHTPIQGTNEQDVKGIQSSSRRSASPPYASRVTSTEDSPLFYFDALATAVPADPDLGPTHPLTSVLPGHQNLDNKLLLPSHVSLLVTTTDGVGSVEVVPPPTVDEDDDYIDFLDYDDRKAPGLVRYFEAEADESGQPKPSIFKCKNCGAEGDHKTYECPVLICLTCGARDEHSTRSCPISKTCYTCGMKGHINKTCPNRYSRSIHTSELYDDCDRCGSKNHRVNECPTIWRIYQYVTDEERILITESREKRRQLHIGEGGEGYIGPEEWCYNCANTGHLGDDCDELPRPSGTPVEPSAFSMHNTMSGPFYDSATDPIRIRRGPRDLLENDVLTRLPDDLGAGIPIDVGKRGRYKDREKLEKRFREQEDDDPEDWFNDSRNIGRGTKEAPPPRGKIMKFGNSVKDGGRHHFRPSPSSGERPPSLLARLGDRADQRSHSIDDTQAHTTSFRIRGAANHHRNDNGKYPGRHDRSQERYREDRNRKSDRDHRPRYSGGYNR